MNLYAKAKEEAGEVVKIQSSVKNNEPAYLHEFLEICIEEINGMLDDLPDYTDAGFQVLLLR